jgi:MFS family permease
MALLSSLTGKLSDIAQPKYIVSIGLLLDSMAFISLSMLTIDTSILYIIIALSLLGIGSALFSSPNTNAIMGSVDKKSYGMASGLIGTARVYGQSFSMSILSLLFSIYIGNIEVQKIEANLLITTINRVFMIFGIIALLAILPSILRGDLKRR